MRPRIPALALATRGVRAAAAAAAKACRGPPRGRLRRRRRRRGRRGARAARGQPRHRTGARHGGRRRDPRRRPHGAEPAARLEPVGPRDRAALRALARGGGPHPPGLLPHRDRLGVAPARGGGAARPRHPQSGLQPRRPALRRLRRPPRAAAGARVAPARGRLGGRGGGHGSPAWAAGPPAGCERRGTEARSRTPQPAALPAYERLVRAVLAEARAQGAELRWWSAWNEPNRYRDPLPPARGVPPRGRVGGRRPLRRPRAGAPVGARRRPRRAGLHPRRPRGHRARRPGRHRGARVRARPPGRRRLRRDRARPARLRRDGPGSRPGRHGGAAAARLPAAAHRLDHADRRARGARRRARGPLPGAPRRAAALVPGPVRLGGLPVHRAGGRAVPDGPGDADLTRAFPALGLWQAWGGEARPRPDAPAPADTCG